MRPAILNDLTKCIGCRACVRACQEMYGLPSGDEEPVLTATRWTTVEHRAGLNIRRHCMHCLEPACASACPVAALHKSEQGPVVYDEARCIGCRYCMIACPFNVPRYEWASSRPLVRKCIMCAEKRLSKGLPPACTAACPTGASKFGDREALIQEAHQRILEHPGRYVSHIYGLREAGGTSVLYLSSVPFDQLGFADAEGSPYPELTWAVLSKLPNVVSIGGVGLFGLWWLFRRKVELAEERRATGERSTGAGGARSERGE